MIERDRVKKTVAELMCPSNIELYQGMLQVPISTTLDKEIEEGMQIIHEEVSDLVETIILNNSMPKDEDITELADDSSTDEVGEILSDVLTLDDFPTFLIRDAYGNEVDATWLLAISDNSLMAILEERDNILDELDNNKE